MAHRGDALEAATPLEKDIRVISPTEAKRLLGSHTIGFSLNPLTQILDLATEGGKNAVGNTFAVPVIARLLTALTLCLQHAASSPSSLVGPPLAFADVPRHPR